MPKKPSRLAVLPRSRFDANLVALLINSGRLLELPLACSLSLTASRLSLAGLFAPRSLIDEGTEPKGVAEPLDPIAPPFSRPPSTALTRGSKGVVGVLVPDVGTLVLFEIGALGLRGAGTAEVSSNWEYIRPLSGPLGGERVPAAAATAPRPAFGLSSLLAGEGPPLSTSGGASPLLMCFNEGFPGLPMLTFRTKPVFSS